MRNTATSNVAEFTVTCPIKRNTLIDIVTHGLVTNRPRVEQMISHCRTQVNKVWHDSGKVGRLQLHRLVSLFESPTSGSLGRMNCEALPNKSPCRYEGSRGLEDKQSPSIRGADLQPMWHWYGRRF